MFTIGLQAIELYGYHGFYPEEQLIGGTFRISLKASFPEAHFQQEDLDSSINYERLHSIVKQCFFAQKYRVLESLIQAILDAVQQDFPFVSELSVCIEKLNPPLGGKVAASFVELRRTI